MDQIYAIPGFAEPVSSLTHLAGAGVFFCLSPFLLRRRGQSAGRFIALLIFGFSCVFLLSMSGVYHLLPKDAVGRLVLQRLDHAAIFVLIAATFTAVHSVLFSGTWRWAVIVLVWVTSATGITLKTVFFSTTPELLGLTIYIALGWLGFISGVALWRRYGFSFIKPLLNGGVAYSVGGVLEFFQQPILLSLA